jgi:hypothetical protein
LDRRQQSWFSTTWYVVPRQQLECDLMTEVCLKNHLSGKSILGIQWQYDVSLGNSMPENQS